MEDITDLLGAPSAEDLERDASFRILQEIMAERDKARRLHSTEHDDGHDDEALIVAEIERFDRSHG